MKDLRLDALKAGDGPILITGHTGFKGAWLTLLLEKLGIPVVGFSLDPIKDSFYQRLGLQGTNEEVFGDVRDKDQLEKFIKKTKPLGIIHLAAQPLVLDSYRFPIETFETNVMGTANVLAAAGTVPSVKALVVVTTDKVYLNKNSNKWFVETDPLQGKDPYSASKVGSEAAADAWRQIYRSSGGPLIGKARAGNVIGGGDLSKDRLIPDLVRAYLFGAVCEIRNPDSTRPWQHALDPLLGYVLYLNHLLSGNNTQAINFGPREPSLKVSTIVDLVKNAWNNIPITYGMPEFSGDQEATYLDLDSTFAEDSINWRPTWTQEEAVLKTINWWSRVKQGESSLELSRKEVSQFLQV